MNDAWINILSTLHARHEGCVLLTLLGEKGSVPRDGGTKMIVTLQESWLTIGGGNLEYQCIAIARDMLMQHATQPRIEHFNLGARAGQCCGGMTTVLLEPLILPQPHIVVFGAGHVGHALVSLLATLPCRVSWVDEREEMFRQVPPGIVTRHLDDPLDAVTDSPAGSYFVVMTHHHPRDLALAEAILKRGDYRYFGLIGSHTKRQRFTYQLTGKGISEARLATMRCPVGLPDVKGKLPAEIAVAIAGEIIAVYHQSSTTAVG
ncbi:xanthine dehydrogenase accessory protein XdhC [Pectobacterium actinidiae]|uniref:xanthine dehydrogenase accessory protein XdhC n=1 Tax=Pectobacterium actinidiae TaxID=1507808 RepID=UPI00119862B0|nr:xanthine dehydrogenase accessory protein XdhC [Pectobacterium actinidiae]MDY4315571.1 xanthine dehydrogenase accessory protein XdhC [Pectobacterium actinidiae]QDX98587.1 xanthine dehydrogenase accessory protein XdhC [Pectobacterium carotovorum subsp. carotovorum]GLW36323.1 xanthine dehydrogenase accessory protein XdhC [Pectobacterium carotovorum subsp. carotovorum]